MAEREVACGDPVGRSYFYPAIGLQQASKRKDFREYFLKYDIKIKILSSI
jgi:hypothetical protein